MDGERFDECARLIGSDASRRRMIKGVVPGFGAFVFGVREGDGARAGECQDSSSSAGACPNGVSDCCNGYLCEYGARVGDFGAPCVAEEFCSDSFTCSHEDGTACTGDGDCECRLTVVACLEEGEQCLGGGGGAFVVQGLAGCCQGLECVFESGTCEVVSTCGVEGDPCAAERTGCCDPLTCRHANGEPGLCVLHCGIAGDTRVIDLDCCLPDFVCSTESGLCEAATSPTCSVEGEGCESDC